ncbi:MAG: hypothetical protein PHO06_00960 [Clostridia bacterium]|nr:hypothetical protein [Clostridia bacterium]
MQNHDETTYFYSKNNKNKYNVNNNFMLDVRSKYVLKYLVNMCSEGSYKIIEIDEFLAVFPQKIKADKDVIYQIIKHLENGGYISVKYADDDQYCISPLPFGRQFIENDEMQNKNRVVLKSIGVKIYFFAFFSALIGAFIGTIIYNFFF